MLQPESALLQLVERLEERVREKEAELAEFERRAQEHIDALKEDLARNRKRIELFRNEMTAMETEASPVKPFDFIPTARSTPAVPSDNTSDEASQSARIRAAARIILSETGRPMMQAEIQSEMKNRGIHIVSTRLIELIRAALRRGKEFKHIKNEGWTLVDEGDDQGK
ncbi:hypothetical protein [Rhizobium binxianense]